MTNPVYARLGPLTVAERFRLSTAAIDFFYPLRYPEICRILKRQPEAGTARPFSGMDFLQYLEQTKQFPEAMRYMQRIGELLAQLARAHILTEVGPGTIPLLGTHYYFLRQLTTKERQGGMWLGSALGPEFLAHAFSPSVIHLTGRGSQGDERGATALVIAPNWLLTCAHVVNQMRLYTEQTHGQATFTIGQTLPHSNVDVAVLEISPHLEVLRGLAFRDPVWAEPILTFGYPRIPLSREPALLIHRGEITAPAVKTFAGHELFLYSAVARPGNSGGPIVSLSGYVVGMVTEELSERSEVAGMGVPFFAGIGTSVIAKAVAELTDDFDVPVEDYQ